MIVVGSNVALLVVDSCVEVTEVVRSCGVLGIVRSSVVRGVFGS